MVYTETKTSNFQPYQNIKNTMSVLADLHNNNNNNNPTLDVEPASRHDKHITQAKRNGNKSVKKLAKIDVSKAKPFELDPSPKNNDRNKTERNKLDEYYYQHREEKLEYQKNYNRQKGDAIKDYNKSYYMKRREEILEKARTKVTCECGCVVQLFNMNSHKKTKKHVRYLEMRQAMTNAVVDAAD